MHLTYATERIFNLRSQQGTCRGPLPLRKPASAGSLQSALPVQRNLHAPYFTDECPAIDLQLLSRKIFLNARRSSALEILEISPRILSFPSCNDVDSSGFHSSGWDRRLRQWVIGCQSFWATTLPPNFWIRLPNDTASSPTRIKPSATLLQKFHNSQYDFLHKRHVSVSPI